MESTDDGWDVSVHQQADNDVGWGDPPSEVNSLWPEEHSNEEPASNGSVMNRSDPNSKVRKSKSGENWDSTPNKFEGNEKSWGLGDKQDETSSSNATSSHVKKYQDKENSWGMTNINFVFVLLYLLSFVCGL